MGKKRDLGEVSLAVPEGSSETQDLQGKVTLLAFEPFLITAKGKC